MDCKNGRVEEQRSIESRYKSVQIFIGQRSDNHSWQTPFDVHFYVESANEKQNQSDSNKEEAVALWVSRCHCVRREGRTVVVRRYVALKLTYRKAANRASIQTWVRIPLPMSRWESFLVWWNMGRGTNWTPESEKHMTLSDIQRLKLKVIPFWLPIADLR